MEIIWKTNNNALQIFKAIEKTNTIINIILNQAGLMIMGMDSSQTSLVQLVLPTSFFLQFNCSTPMELGVRTDSMVAILSKVKNNQLIWKASSDIALSIWINTPQAASTEFRLRCIEVREDRLSIPETNYDVSLRVSPVILTEILDKMLMAKSELKFKIDSQNLKMITDSTEFGIICHEESLINKERFESNVNQTVCLLFGYNAIQLILWFCKVSKNKLFLGLSSEMPLKLKLHLGDDASLTIYIAPKINE